MCNNSSVINMFKEELKLVPNKPGSYQMYDESDTVIYVGKAKNLKKRLSSYFRGTHTGKTAKMISNIAYFKYIVTNTELESFILEINLIKKYNPKYNILLKDDKSYPYIEYTRKPFPSLKVVRYLKVKKSKDKILFGPYVNAYAARRIVNLINRLYPLKKCEGMPKEVCLYYHIHECLGYCTKHVNSEDIINMENEIISFLRGNEDIIKNKLKEKIYKRTILLYPLLTNELTGGISAAVEIDENRTKCGRYSYCWPRDAIFITNSLDILGMTKETEKYYKTFCKMTQSKNGMWEQRFYTDGSLAPCWGYQIDETASVVYGIYNHYEHIKNAKFLKDTLRMSESAIKFLKKYVQNVLDEKEEEYKSYDLWEENEGIHTYSLATIFSSFDAMIKIYEIVKPEFEKNRLKIEKIEKELQILRKYLVEIKNYILKNLYDNNKKTFIRNKDQKMDISLLGLVISFIS